MHCKITTFFSNSSKKARKKKLRLPHSTTFSGQVHHLLQVTRRTDAHLHLVQLEVLAEHGLTTMPCHRHNRRQWHMGLIGICGPGSPCRVCRQAVAETLPTQHARRVPPLMQTCAVSPAQQQANLLDAGIQAIVACAGHTSPVAGHDVFQALLHGDVYLFLRLHLSQADENCLTLRLRML